MYSCQKSESCIHVLQKLMTEAKKKNSLLSVHHLTLFLKVRERSTISSSWSNCITSWSLSGDGSHRSDCRVFPKVSSINFRSSITYLHIAEYILRYIIHHKGHRTFSIAFSQVRKAFKHHLLIFKTASQMWLWSLKKKWIVNSERKKKKNTQKSLKGTLGTTC